MTQHETDPTTRMTYGAQIRLCIAQRLGHASRSLRSRHHAAVQTPDELFR